VFNGCLARRSALPLVQALAIYLGRKRVALTTSLQCNGNIEEDERRGREVVITKCEIREGRTKWEEQITINDRMKSKRKWVTDDPLWSRPHSDRLHNGGHIGGSKQHRPSHHYRIRNYVTSILLDETETLFRKQILNRHWLRNINQIYVQYFPIFNILF